MILKKTQRIDATTTRKEFFLKTLFLNCMNGQVMEAFNGPVVVAFSRSRTRRLVMNHDV